MWILGWVRSACGSLHASFSEMTISLFFKSSASMICENCLSWAGRVIVFSRVIPDLFPNVRTSSIKRLGAPRPQTRVAVSGVPGVKFVRDSIEKRMAGELASE